MNPASNIDGRVVAPVSCCIQAKDTRWIAVATLDDGTRISGTVRRTEAAAVKSLRIALAHRPTPDRARVLRTCVTEIARTVVGGLVRMEGGTDPCQNTIDLRHVRQRGLRKAWRDRRG